MNGTLIELREEEAIEIVGETEGDRKEGEREDGDKERWLSHVRPN